MPFATTSSTFATSDSAQPQRPLLPSTIRRLVIAGTGTGVGKTHVACTLVRALILAGRTVSPLKPIETGLAAPPTDQDDLDAALLAALGGSPRTVPATEGPPPFHVKPSSPPPTRTPTLGSPTPFLPHTPPTTTSLQLPSHSPSPFWFPLPLSPHLAARRAGRQIALPSVLQWLAANVSATADTLLVETAGALFSPLSPALTNFDLILALQPAQVILVAPDRLGVLHDVTTTLALLKLRGGPPPFLVLSQPTAPDSSTGTNAAELHALRVATPLAVFPNASPAHADSLPPAEALLRALGMDTSDRPAPIARTTNLASTLR